MGILIQTLLRGRNADFTEGLNSFLSCLFLVQLAVTHQHFCQMSTDLLQRIKRCHRILENHGKFFASHFSSLVCRKLQQIASHINQTVCCCLSILRKQSHNGFHQDTLAAAGFSYHSQNISVIHMDTGSAHSFNLCLVDHKGGLQIIYGQKTLTCLCHLILVHPQTS